MRPSYDDARWDLTRLARELRAYESSARVGGREEWRITGGGEKSEIAATGTIEGRHRRYAHAAIAAELTANELGDGVGGEEPWPLTAGCRA